MFKLTIKFSTLDPELSRGNLNIAFSILSQFTPRIRINQENQSISGWFNEREEAQDIVSQLSQDIPFTILWKTDIKETPFK